MGTLHSEFLQFVSSQYHYNMTIANKIIDESPYASRAVIAKELNLTDGQAKTVLSKLKTRKLIHREGSDTNGKWIID